MDVARNFYIAKCLSGECGDHVYDTSLSTDHAFYGNKQDCANDVESDEDDEEDAEQVEV